MQLGLSTVKYRTPTCPSVQTDRHRGHPRQGSPDRQVVFLPREDGEPSSRSTNLVKAPLMKGGSCIAGGGLAHRPPFTITKRRYYRKKYLYLLRKAKKPFDVFLLCQSSLTDLFRIPILKKYSLLIKYTVKSFFN